MWCGMNLSSYKTNHTNLNFYDEHGDEYVRYYDAGTTKKVNCCWRTPSTSGNKEAWDYMFDCYFKGKIPEQFNYLKEAMDSML